MAGSVGKSATNEKRIFFSCCARAANQLKYGAVELLARTQTIWSGFSLVIRQSLQLFHRVDRCPFRRIGCRAKQLILPDQPVPEFVKIFRFFRQPIYLDRKSTRLNS